MRLAGVILAGGSSDRMSVSDKAVAMLDGRRLVDHVYSRLAPQVENLVINGRQDYGLGLPTAPDRADGVIGPVAGIRAGLLWATDLGNRPDGILTAPVDCPYLPEDLARRLASGSGPTYAVDGTDQHPTFGFWPLNILDEFADDLHRKEPMSLREWAALTGASPVKFDDAHAFTNINTDDDLERARQRSGGT